MLSRAALSAARAVPRAAVRGARNSSTNSSPEELYAAKELWFKTAVLASAFFLVPYTAYIIVLESGHEHHERHEMPWSKIRSKAFPWAENDCPLFDLECKKAARAKMQ